MKRYLSTGNFHLGLTNDKGITKSQSWPAIPMNLPRVPRDQWTSAGNSRNSTLIHEPKI